MTNTKCNHESTTATTDADGIECAWECDDCGHLIPFIDWDYVFSAHAYYPPKPEGATLAWNFMSRDDMFAHYAK